MMKRILALVFSFTGWFALIMQYNLMLEHSDLPFWEITIRFFSYFTILTNLIVAAYFTFQIFNRNPDKKSGTLTAITVYILIVGLIYQIILRSTWNPTGMQKLVDELLHTIIPVLVVTYWYIFENKTSLNYRHILKWSIYPLLYLIYILIRGNFSGFYPYPFINVSEIGFTNVIINSFWILIFFTGLSVILIKIGKTFNQ
ncbi:Pr6Pr family membrane protein [Chryseobacterium sp. JUb7]|uniref:Pr6Pr family membrane protein n=1 Tax=Chryseobacterium sp. JUb7 TaxID=2940599 RepID=UPI00216A8788|nr:Pr6Pr family membrane protein [Chryseobacterium sp. JUb7]MCS3532093.1 hypothetical protein [Chryseobacterium sp. JUb7]